MSENLPAIITRVGGSLEQVVQHIELYTDERYPLDRRSQIALARLIEGHTEFNNEKSVSLLVDALAWHGIKQGQEFNELLQQYDIQTMHLALDYLYEIGVRTHGLDDDIVNEDKKYQSMAYVGRVAELLNRMQQLIVVETVEELASAIYYLGGLDKAFEATDEDIENVPFHDSLKHYADDDETVDDGRDSDDDQ